MSGREGGGGGGSGGSSSAGFNKAQATTPDGPPCTGAKTPLMFSEVWRALEVPMLGLGREQGVECRSLSQM